MIDYQNLFFMHLFMIIFIGGFVGEAVRTPQNASMISRVFFMNVAGIAFISFLAGWAIYERTRHYVWALIAAGFISFQSVEKIKRFSITMAENNLKTALKILQSDKEDK